MLGPACQLLGEPNRPPVRIGLYLDRNCSAPSLRLSSLINESLDVVDLRAARTTVNKKCEGDFLQDFVGAL